MDQAAVQELVRQAGGWLMLGFTGAIALLGQWIKKHEQWDSRWAVVGMIAAGMLVYGLRSGWPMQFEWNSIEAWLAAALPAAMSIVGVASAIGHFLPQWFKTDSKPKETP